MSQSHVNRIVEGQTTMDQIIAWFGQPDFQTRMGDKTLYTYEHTKSRSQTAFLPYWTKSDTAEESDELTIVFDGNGVVETYSITRSA